MMNATFSARDCSRRHACAHAWLAILLTLLAPVAFGAVAVADDRPPEPTEVAAPEELAPELRSVTLSTEAIEQAKEGIRSRDDLDEAVRQQIIDVYQRALTALAEARTWQERSLEWEQQRQAAAGEREAVERDLTQTMEAAIEVPPDATLEAVRQLRDQAEAELRAAQERASELEREQARRAERRQQIPNELVAARNSLEQVQESLATVPPAEQLPELTRARRTEQRAVEQQQQYRIESLQRELANYNARTDLLPLRRERASRRIVHRETMLRDWRQVVEQRVTREAALEAEAARRAAAEASPAVRDIAEQTLELIERRTGPNGVLARTQRAREQHERLQTQLIDLINRYERDRQRVIVAGMEGLTDVRLRAQRAEMPDPRAMRQEARERQRELARVQRELADLEYERGALPPIVTQRTELLEQIDHDQPEDVLADITIEIDRQLGRQRAQYDALIEAYREYEDWLTSVQEVQLPLISLSSRYIDFIDERILWIPSAETIGTTDIPDAFRTLSRFLNPSDWHDVLNALSSDFQRNPIVPLLGVAILVLYFMVLARLRRRLRRIATLVPLSHSDNFALSLKAFFITIALAAFWPLVLLFISRRLNAPADAPALAGICAFGLGRTAIVLFTVNFAQQLTRPNGLADIHFRWRRETRLMLRRHMRWLLMVLLPATFIVAAVERDMQGAGSDALSRIAFIAAMIGFAIFITRVLQPGVGIQHGIVSRSNGGWLERLQYVWYPLAILVPLALAGLAAAGYYYTALQLADRLTVTVWFIFVLIVANGLVLRWLFIARRNMALAEARKRREAAQAEAAASSPETVPTMSEAGELIIDEPTMDISSIDAQATQLLRSIVGFAFFIGVWMIWAKMLPALGMLDRIEIWPNFGNVREAAIAPPPARDIVWVYQPQLFEVTPEPTGEQPAAAPHESDASSSGPASSPVDQNSAAGNPGANPGASGARPPPPFTGRDVQFDADARAAMVQQQSQREEVNVVTLTNLIIAIAIVIITIIVSKNIPGLLEITLLKKLPLEPSGRYAVTTLTRYVLSVIGIIVAFGAIGIGWSEVQWLVAAITLGIGFGLQEIVANFISGIIILFEQPVRVGDTVTVGNVSGTVTRIRIRATTITDWDRKELLIPNKEFITGQVINWTLSDPILRVVIPVGIAYGSDTAKAEQVLMQVAENHPVVLNDPPPSVVFSEFGDSSLNFNLRVFIPNITELIKVRHEMHNAIDRAFREAGIEIAFPQRDIHVRSVRHGIPLTMRDERTAGDGQQKVE